MQRFSWGNILSLIWFSIKFLKGVSKNFGSFPTKATLYGPFRMDRGVGGKLGITKSSCLWGPSKRDEEGGINCTTKRHEKGALAPSSIKVWHRITSSESLGMHNSSAGSWVPNPHLRWCQWIWNLPDFLYWLLSWRTKALGVRLESYFSSVWGQSDLDK